MKIQLKKICYHQIINQINQFNQNLKINNINYNQELKGIKNGYNWRYVGQVVNGLREGKGIFYRKNGDRYEGDWRNDKKEGKGIYYYNNGDREMGDYYNDEPIGKHAYLTKNGEVKTKYY